MSAERPNLRVIELGSWLAAPSATALLADMGAQVIKVEPPSGDPGRRFIQAMGGNTESTPSFSLLNRGKKSVVIDLALAAGRACLERLLASADVFVTNLRAGSLERLRLSPETVMARHPRLIFASITGVGLHGPERDRPTFDVGGFWARSGIMHQVTPNAAAPPSPTGGFGDLVTSLAMYAAIVTALLERQRTGRGRLVSTSLLQAGAFTASADLAAQAAHGRVPGQMSRTDSRTPMVNSYQSGDGHWFFLTGVDAERLFPNVCRAIGRPELIADERFATAQAIRRNGRELVSILDRAFAERTMEDWAVRFAREDVWWQPVAAPGEVLEDVQLKTNNMLHLIWNGSAAYPMVTSPFGSFRTTSEPLRAPSLGEHTEEILGGLGSDAGSKV